ncbi:TspO/MBR family protein [Candidatus Oscillochloris fontis]|uniref:TspO/MBR family protein n=1 Tax=Candidatus Oscillochloris fontis TaxID=2496868 RepID=UPI0013762B95|nr:TspO/MBR family protein [Candidatus Oscillochloris fontis]
MSDLQELSGNPDQPQTADLVRQTAVIAALATTITINTLANTLPLNNQSTAEISARYPLKITPPGYVFSIWALIYSGLVGYGVYQALPGQRTNPRLRKIGWLFVLSCMANVTWIYLWHYNRQRLSVGAIIGMLLALIGINRHLGKPLQGTWGEKLMVRMPFSIYLGWISIATLVNISVVLYDIGWDSLGLDPDVWTTGLIGTGTALGAGMGALRGDATYPLVMAWAFNGIAQKQADSALISGAARAGTLTSILSAIVGIWRGR